MITESGSAAGDGLESGKWFNTKEKAFPLGLHLRKVDVFVLSVKDTSPNIKQKPICYLS